MALSRWRAALRRGAAAGYEGRLAEGTLSNTTIIITIIPPEWPSGIPRVMVLTEWPVVEVWGRGGEAEGD